MYAGCRVVGEKSVITQIDEGVKAWCLKFTKRMGKGMRKKTDVKCSISHLRPASFTELKVGLQSRLRHSRPELVTRSSINVGQAFGQEPRSQAS